MFWKLFNNSKHELQSCETDDNFKAETDEEKNTNPERKIDPDYRMTIFLSLFNKSPRKKRERFPGYVAYELGIINVEQYFDELRQRQLIEPASEKDMLSLLKVSELKAILVDNGLKKAGNKPVLIERILKEVDLSQIELLTEPYYSLSQKGIDFLASHDDFIKIRQNSQWGIGIEEYLQMKEISNSDISFEDIILSLLNRKLLEIKKKRYSLSQYEYSRLHEIYISIYQLLQDKGEPQNAIKPLLSSLLLSVSGCENYWLIGYKRGLKLKNVEVLKSYVPIHIDEFVATYMIGLEDYYSKQIASDVYHNFVGPFNLCTLEMFEAIIQKVFSSSTSPDLGEYDEIIKKDFIKKLK